MKKNTEKLKSELSLIKNESNAQISSIQNVLKDQTDVHLLTIKKLQKQISENKAYSCSESEQLELVITFCITFKCVCYLILIVINRNYYKLTDFRKIK